MSDSITIFLTWTTYGTWMPGDSRGWRKRKGGQQLPRPLLAEWCRKQMKGEAVLLKPHDRNTVEEACFQHCEHRRWHLLAVNARTNHVHVVVVAGLSPQKVRDQLKANCTRALRQPSTPLVVDRTWTTGTCQGEAISVLNNISIVPACDFPIENSQPWRVRGEVESFFRSGVGRQQVRQRRGIFQTGEGSFR